MNAGRLILIDLLTVAAESGERMGLLGHKLIINRYMADHFFQAIMGGMKMNGHIPSGKVRLEANLRDCNVRVERMAVDDISVMLGVIGEFKELDSGAGIVRKLQSHGNHAIFRRKNQEKIRKRGKEEAP